MVEVKHPLKMTFEHVDTHVIFIHGLQGDLVGTWKSGGEFWPHWLEEQANIATWSIGYPAARTNWCGGGAMSIEERAPSILHRLLAVPELRQGTIVLVGHSMGGLIIKEVLRLASERAATDPQAGSFESRVRKIAFIATPHQGSWMSTLAKWLGPIARPTTATSSLESNSPHLASLNAWFRNYATTNSVDVLGFGETQRTFWGKVVPQDSSDLGLPSPSTFIPLDADHFSISAPKDRNAVLYVCLKDLVQRPPLAVHPHVLQSQKLDEVSGGVQELLRKHSGWPKRGVANTTIDRSAAERVLRMRRSRYFFGEDTTAVARGIARDIQEGDLCNASLATASNALAWCARLLSSDDPDEAERLVKEASRLGTGDEIKIAFAFIAAARGDKDGALNSISSIKTPLGQSATLMIGLNGLTSPEAMQWINGGGPAFGNLDGDGKYAAMSRMIAECEVDPALEVVSLVTSTDTEYCPPLHHFVGMAHMLAAVPLEMQKLMVEHTPFDLAQFPLKEDLASLAHLRVARENFAGASQAAALLGCEAARQKADDLALWLGLRDPKEVVTAREKLIRSLADSRDMVRRVPMAIQFGLQLDRVSVDRAITAIEAKGGPDGGDALFARFALALEDDDAGTVATFVGANRIKLSHLLGATAISSFEIRALAKADRQAEAQARLTELRTSGTATDAELQKLDRDLAEMRGEDSISSVEARFLSSGTLEDLIALVSRLQGREEWSRLAPYARQLFDRLNDLKSAVLFTRAAHRSRDWSGVVGFLEGKKDLLDRSDDLRQIYAWSLYFLGEIARARETLAPLLATREHPDDRALQINVAICSGDWGSLGPIVEHAWNNRAIRSAADLLEAGQIGAIIGSPRTRELIREAVEKSPADAAILVAAYHAAVSGGWEDDEVVGRWLETALATSEGGNGAPIRQVSLDDLISSQPDWERREGETWDLLTKGQMPLFIAAMQLNRTIISMLLTPALANLDQADPRKRGILQTFCGRAAASISLSSAQVRVEPQTGMRRAIDQTKVALDVSSLLILSFLERLKLVVDRFQQIVIPHSTMNWLINERQRTQFHQPSQVRNARELRNLLSQDAYFIVDASGRPDPDLADEVGEELAVLLESARSSDEGPIQKVVVRPGPVHRPASLMKDNADLAAYCGVLCACGDVVAALIRQGQLTDGEATRARNYLSLHEVQWEWTLQLQPGATLLLDDLAISTLQHLRLIGKLGMAGFKIGIPRGRADRVDALIRHEAYATETIGHIEHIRSSLADGIASGKVILGPAAKDQDEENPQISANPTALLFGLARLVDLVIVDDRALNQFANIDANGTYVSVGCTLDLLDMLERSAAINASERTESETKLRRAGFQMMPLRLQDILRLVETAPIQNGKLQETAHLKSVRESIDRLRMTDALQLPADQLWLRSLFTMVCEGVRAQWNDETVDATARARSEWFLGLLHLQGWSHRFHAANGPEEINNRYRSMLWLIMSIPHAGGGESTRRYSAWMEDTLIAQLHSHDPASLDYLVEQAMSYIESVSEQLDQRRSDDG